MNITEELDHSKLGYMSYPAAILMIADKSPQTFELKQKLEYNGCQVHLMDIKTDGLAAARQKYADLIVLNIKQPTGSNFEIYQKLKAFPELASIAVVMPATCDRVKEVSRGLNRGTIYYLTQDAFNETGLMPIIEWTLYITYRYLPLCIS